MRLCIIRKKSRTNIITHSTSFYGEPTVELKKNPDLSKPSGRKSGFSVPRWENNSYLTEKPKGFRRMSNADRKNIHKFNRKHKGKKKK